MESQRLSRLNMNKGKKLSKKTAVFWVVGKMKIGITL